MTTCKISGKVLTKFDFKEFTVNGKTIKVSDAYSQCNVPQCDSVQLWDTEMYWQDTGGGVYHEHMGDYDGVCDECFHKLKKENTDVKG